MSEEPKEIDLGEVAAGTGVAWRVHVKYRSEDRQDQVKLDCKFSFSQRVDGGSWRKYMIVAEIQLPSQPPSKGEARLHLKSPSLNDETNHEEYQFLLIDGNSFHDIPCTATLYDILAFLTKKVLVSNLSRYVRGQLLAAVYHNRIDILRRELHSDQLDLSQLQPALYSALKKGNVPIMLELLAAGASISTVGNTEEWSVAFIKAVKNGVLDVACELLEYFPVLEMVRPKRPVYRPPVSLLKSFASIGCTDMVLELFKRGADMGTSLYEAVSSDNAETVRVFVDRQTSMVPHVLDNHRCLYRHERCGSYRAVNKDIVHQLVRAVIADPTIPAPKIHAQWFSQACYARCIDIIEDMISAGIEAKYYGGGSLEKLYWGTLIKALCCGHADVARVLLRRTSPTLFGDDGQPEYQLFLTNSFSEILEKAVLYDRNEVLTILLNDLRGQLPDYNGREVFLLGLAVKLRNRLIAEILIEHGAAITDDLLTYGTEFLDLATVNLLMEIGVNPGFDAAKVDKAFTSAYAAAVEKKDNKGTQQPFRDDVMRRLVHAGAEGLITAEFLTQQQARKRVELD